MIPTILTERLTLRGPEMADLAPMAAFMAGPRAGYVGGPLDEGECWRMLLRIAGHWQLRGYGMWIIAPRAGGPAMGWTGILHHIDWPEPELGWTLFDGAEGKGIGFEAATAARDAASSRFGIQAPISMINPANARSNALAKRLGAVLEEQREAMGQMLNIYRHPMLEGRQ